MAKAEIKKLTKEGVINMLTAHGFDVTYRRRGDTEKCESCQAVQLIVTDSYHVYEYFPSIFVDECVDIMDSDPKDIINAISESFDISDEVIACVASDQMAAAKDRPTKICITDEIVAQKDAFSRLYSVLIECLFVIAEDEGFADEDDEPAKRYS